MDRLRIEFWWAVERFAGWLWLKLCPDNKASFWLNWFPAWAYKQRKDAEYDGTSKCR